MIVGLTGGIGAGKSTVATLFADHGVPVISCDEIALQIVNTDKAVQQAIIQKFGNGCLTANHTIDRHALRQIIFSNQQHKIWLEKLLHPLIAHELIIRAKNCTFPYCIVEIPLLIEAGMQNLVDRILTVDCSKAQQLKQALARGRHSESEIKAIIASQTTQERRRIAANDIIENTSDLATLRARINELHNLYLSLATNVNR